MKVSCKRACRVCGHEEEQLGGMQFAQTHLHELNFPPRNVSNFAIQYKEIDLSYTFKF